MIGQDAPVVSDVYAELPEPPVNVRVVYMDGGETPVDLVYTGLNGDDLHVWEAVPISPLVSLYASVRCDALPPRTTVVLRVP